ncbi:MAG: PulJ/GspJ family protein [Phycisphaerae bacterium]
MKARRGMTVAELVVSIAVLAVIGAAVAGLSFALSSAHAHSKGHYLHSQTARNGTFRLQRLIRSSVLVTASSETSMVLWTGDNNLDGYINRNEVVLVQWDQSSGELGVYSVALADDDPNNYRVKLKTYTDLTNARGDITIDPMVSYTPLAQGVTEFSLSCSPQPPLTKLVKFRIIAGPPRPQDRPAAVRSAAALSHNMADDVIWTGGEWRLP